MLGLSTFLRNVVHWVFVRPISLLTLHGHYSTRESTTSLTSFPSTRQRPGFSIKVIPKLYISKTTIKGNTGRLLRTRRHRVANSMNSNINIISAFDCTRRKLLYSQG